MVVQIPYALSAYFALHFVLMSFIGGISQMLPRLLRVWRFSAHALKSCGYTPEKTVLLYSRGVQNWKWSPGVLDPDGLAHCQDKATAISNTLQIHPALVSWVSGVWSLSRTYMKVFTRKLFREDSSVDFRAMRPRSPNRALQELEWHLDRNLYAIAFQVVRESGNIRKLPEMLGSSL